MPGPSIYGRFPVKFAVIDTATQGDNTLVSAVAGTRIRVLSFFAVAAGGQTIKFMSATSDIAGDMSLAANGGASADAEVGLFETNPGQALIINLSAAVQVGGAISYIEID